MSEHERYCRACATTTPHDDAVLVGAYKPVLHTGHWRCQICFTSCVSPGESLAKYAALERERAKR